MNHQQRQEAWILPFQSIDMQDIGLVGGKNASLGEMITKLDGLGLLVPPGFATTAHAYCEFLLENKLTDFIDSKLQNLLISDIEALKKAGLAIRDAILEGKLPAPLVEAVTKAYAELNLLPSQSVAVRSSATAEDLPDASFAGQQETFLNVQGIEDVLIAIKRVFASLFMDRAISYRVDQNFDYRKIAISAGVQLMVRSDLASSGVVFTIDTETGFDQAIFITAAYGLGECIVQGEVNPDEFYVHKPMLRENKAAIISRKLGSKQQKMIYAEKCDEEDCTKRVPVETEKQGVFCINDQDILSLAKMALLIEDHYGRPMDIEWAKDGNTQTLFIIQARPETVVAEKSRTVLENYALDEKGDLLLSGRSVGQKIGNGYARLIASPKDMVRMKKGDILVTDMTDPDWEPIMKLASAIVTNRGGRTCHAAIIARELGIPAVVGCESATTTIKEGQEITVSCAEGETGFVYEGRLTFTVTKTDIAELPALPVKLCMNLANPEQAFLYQSIPNEGVGLARLEFIISNMIGIHPNALLHLDQLEKNVQAEIKSKISAYSDPIEFYTEKLAEGVAMIGAAFYPKPIIVRFSDFKSNEYANLLGGAEYEPKEENPMLGFRGASRYISPNFQACFALECAAIKRVREEKGLTNVHVMFPFVRTVAELTGLVEELKRNQLERGKDGLKLYMMCEIPSNALLADQFLPHVDGFSIGSNDLTQLTLGLDRDSSLIAHLFDERDDAVKSLLKLAIDACNKAGKYVGICGQGPSDHPDFAAWLMKQGIQSISLSPDSIVSTWLMLSSLEK
jgi:pyruvate,water dikinase